MQENVYFDRLSRVFSFALRILHPYELIDGSYKKSKNAIYFIVVHVAVMYVIFTFVTDDFSDNKAPSFAELSENAAVLLTAARNLIFKIFALFFSLKIKSLFERIISDRKSSCMHSMEWKLSLSYTKKEFWGSTIAFVSGSASLAFVTLSAPFLKFNERQLPLNFFIGFLPFEEISINWFLNYIFQCSFAWFGGSFYFAYIPMVFTLMNHSCFGFDVLTHMIKNLETDMSKKNENSQRKETEVAKIRREKLFDKKMTKEIKQIVERSYKVLEWHQNITDFLKFKFLVDFCSLAFTLCFFLVALTVEPSVSTLVYLASPVVLLQLFIYCWMGNQVTDRIDELAEAIYELEWYEMSIQHQKELQLILIMAQNTKGLNGIFNEVNMETFTNV